ncbi:MAG: alkaline phosphatase family protein [Clostridia bacterium]|nr:alkaline phosphatase family protein [Clostridia bacterium]
MKKSISVLLSVILLFGCASFAYADESADTFNSFGAYKHVFIIGVDGCGAAWEKVDSPNFDRIFADNAYRYNAHTEYITVSAQNWGSILTGVAYDVHKFDNGWCENNERDSSSGNNTVFYYARNQFPDAELVSFNNWSAINHGIIENDLNVNKINRGTDPLVVQSIVNYLNSGNEPTLMFVQLDSVDHAAHTYGGFSDQYYKAAEKADGYLGKIYDAVATNGLMKDSLFIVVADHGETVDGHGGQTVEESSAVLGVAGDSVNKMLLSEDVKTRDVASIVLYSLGIEQPEHMTSVLPEGLFGEKSEKTVEPYKTGLLDGLLDSISSFFLNIVVFFYSIFD